MMSAHRLCRTTSPPLLSTSLCSRISLRRFLDTSFRALRIANSLSLCALIAFSFLSSSLEAVFSFLTVSRGAAFSFFIFDNGTSSSSTASSSFALFFFLPASSLTFAFCWMRGVSSLSMSKISWMRLATVGGSFEEVSFWSCDPCSSAAAIPISMMANRPGCWVKRSGVRSCQGLPVFSWKSFSNSWMQESLCIFSSFVPLDSTPILPHLRNR
mmetsp:Transcript_25171/g.83089  ORF Transcript_25171/g.83089 Transcript_25171/m.83089 type:complete len:213 (-) Transcript_25171:1012-1650(-)